MLKAELIEQNKNLVKQNGELLYLLEFGKIRCEDSKHQMIWELDSNAKVLQQKIQKQKEVIDKAIEYINKYAWQEDIIGGIYTTTGKPATDRYMKLEWDNCNELLDILKEVE